ncbi:MAG: NAD-dependent epimerase/dehydratase family protein [Candidatus Micrarchaeota archaeon]
MAKVLVTGGRGFIGSHLSKFLEGKGHDVSIFSKRDGKGGGDIADYDSVLKATSGIDWVFHLAGVSSVSKTGEGSDEIFKSNIAGTHNVLLACHQNKVERVVFASSSYVYGKPQSIPVSEKSALAPRTLYGLSKLVGEEYCRYYSRIGLQTIIARLFNAFGEGQTGRVVPDFILRYKKSKSPVEILGNSADSRDFLSIDQACLALLLLAEKGKSGEAYNVGSGVETRILDLAKLIAQEMGSKNDALRKDLNYEYDEGSALRMFADIGKLKALGFTPKSLDESQLSAMIK